MNKTKISAKIVADSVSPQGDRLISVLCTFPRIILAEINTHRMLSKNTSSSRAIPLKKMVEAIKNDPFIPIAWQKEHTGMQGYEYFTDLENDIPSLEKGWLSARDNAIETAKYLNNCFENEDGSIEGLTKQLCNRLLEPFMWTTMLITGSKEGWDNFFNLRCPQYESHKGNTYKSWKDYIKDSTLLVAEDLKNYSNIEKLYKNKGQAEIHMMTLAEEIYDVMNESTPKQLQAGEWHIPFKDRIDNDILLDTLEDNNFPNDKIQNYLIKISTAMAAHTSYTIVGGEAIKSYDKWIELHDKLIAYDPPHSSPMEHCARAMSDKEFISFFKGELPHENLELVYKGQHGWCNNLKGFIPYRYFIDNNLTI